MSDLPAQIDNALRVLGKIAARPHEGDDALWATVLPQIAILRHAKGIATQNRDYADTTGGKLIAALVAALTAPADAAPAEPSEIAKRALASWGIPADTAAA